MNNEMKSYINDSEYLKDFINDYFNNNIDDLKDEIYLQDKVSEYADGLVDIYNHNLLKWLKDNYSDYEDYIEEFGINSKNFDLMKTIQGAQFMQIESEIMDELGDFSYQFDLDLDI